MFRGRFRWQLIIDSCLPVHDLRDRVPVAGAGYTTNISSLSSGVSEIRFNGSTLRNRRHIYL